MNREPLRRSDLLLIAVCSAIVAASAFIIVKWFYAAFPEASIEFRYDRAGSLPRAKAVLDAQRIDTAKMKHSAVFEGDEGAKTFLERSLGLANANRVMAREVRLWWWRHRWFRPLQEEEFEVDVAPTGEIVGFSDKLPEERALPAIDAAAARRAAESFLTRNGVNLPDLQLVTQSERQLPRRLQRIFTWDSQSVHPAGAPYRYVITVDGDRVSSYTQRLHVPDQWQRDYRDLRSKNILAGRVDDVFFGATIVAAVVIFILRLLRGDVSLRLVLGVGIATVVLMTGTSLNSFPITLAGYDTTMTYPAFLALNVILAAIAPAIGWAMLFVVIVGSGEVLYRERLPQHLAIPRIWQRKALASRRVFLAFVIGYTLVAFFIAYQVAFYLIAEKFGAWSPADVPYDHILNTAFPFIAVLFAGFFPAVMEEFVCRAFSVPFLERVLRSRLAAIVLAGFIWGFGHAMYPNQPFYIRGLEVGLAGVLLGFLLLRFGLLPLLIWHYTVDALYTALLLLRSGNTYYVVSAGLASLVFAIPMLISIGLYVRNGGFIVDDDLSNATIPIHPPPPPGERELHAAEYPPPVALSPTRLLACLAAIALAAILAVKRPPSLNDAIDYRIGGEQAKEIAAPFRHGAKTYVVPVEAFRSWDRESPREEGGAPSGFDGVAVDYLIHHGLPVRSLVDVMRSRIEAGTWVVRSFTPGQKEETLTEVDPRAGRAIGYHKLQDERKLGARLEQGQALIIARRMLPRFGVDGRSLDLKEALAFQQPNRRDWLFHFQEHRPIAAEGYRRVSVRVAGSEVTQLTTTVKIPDEAYREAARTTLLNIVLVVFRILGVLALLSLMVAGFVMAVRKRFPWKRPLIITAVLAAIPIAAAVLRWRIGLFTYDTSISWETFVNGQIISAATGVALQIGLIFLALAGIDAAYPQAIEWLRAEGRARFGRAALVAAVTAIAAVGIRRALLQFLAQAFPAYASFDGVGVPQSVGVPLPAVLGIGEALLFAIELSAGAGLFLFALRSMPRAERLADVVGIVIVIFVMLDPGARAAELPLMLVADLSAALLLWALVRFVLGRNLLAYPLTIFLALLFNSAATLLQNHRPDLTANAIVEIAVAVALAVWMAVGSSQMYAPAVRPFR